MKGRKRGRKVLPNGRSAEPPYWKAGYDMLRSSAWRSLSGNAVKVYVELRSRYNGGNNGKLTLSLDEGARLLGIGKASVQRAFVELEAKGFVVRTRRGQWYGRLASEWRVTEKGQDGHPPTDDWRRWRPRKSGPRFSSGPAATNDGAVSEPDP